MPDRTEAERHLLTFMREAFGEGLSSLLLSGHCEKVSARSRRFVVKLPKESGRSRQRYLRIAATHNSFLPSGHDPLVLSALMKMLFLDEGPGARSVSYTYETILTLLGWPNCIKAGLSVDRAVARYFNLYYQPVETLSELARIRSVRFVRQERLISEYGFSGEKRTNGRPSSGVCNWVVFNSHFVEQLKRKSLFEIDWAHVRSLVAYP